MIVAATRRFAAVGLVLAVAAGSAPARGQSASSAPAAAGPVEVAAFANLSGDPADAWIGDGIAETLAADLGGAGGTAAPGLRVAGAYQRVGGRLRITARLLDPATGRVVAGTRVDGALADLFGLQDELAARLAAAARGAATAEPAADAARWSRLPAGAPPPAVPRPPRTPLRSSPPPPRAASDGGFGEASAFMPSGREAESTAAAPGAAVVGPAAGLGASDAFPRGGPTGAVPGAGPSAAGRGGGPSAVAPETGPSGAGRAGSSGLDPGAGTSAAALGGGPSGAVPGGGTAGAVSGARSSAAGFAAAPTLIDGPPPPLPPEVAARDEAGRLTMRAIRLDGPLQLDGRLDERVYRDVPPVTGFIQQEPVEGAPADDQTEVWVTYDADNLYVSARCWSAAPDRIVANEMKRDSYGMYGNETLGVVLDTFYDRRNAFAFTTNAIGGLFDALVTDERSQNIDWNTVWDVAAGRFDEGWTVEIAIPFKSLRYRAGPAQMWGLNVQRRVASTNETSFLTPIPASLSWAGAYKMSSAATLVGLEVPASGTRLEVKPYGISDVTTDLARAPDERTTAGGDVGFDVKYGVTQGLTADFTYNTDFAQVEVDEQQVNLTRFSLFFPEKREFFLEGQGIFDFGGGFTSDSTAFYFGGGQFSGTAPILFFSRRIGLQDGRTVPIRAGGRLTGKAGPYSIGVLNVQTEQAGRAAATNFSVARVKRDILRRSAVGALFTGRSVSLDGSGSNQVFGVDGLFSFYDNLNVTSYLAQSRLPGVAADDAMSYQAKLDYRGDRWGFLAERLGVGADFRPEVGFVRRHDFRRNFMEGRFSPRPLSIASIRKFLFQGSLDYTTDGAGLLETRARQGLFGIEFENGDMFFAGTTDSYELLKQSFPMTPAITIPAGAYRFTNTRIVYAPGQQRTVSGGLSFDRGGFFGGERTGVGYTFGRIYLSSQLNVEPSLSFNWLELPEGDFRTDLVSVRTTYTLTPRMFVAALVQYNSTLDSLGTNLRFRWEYQPGSELFVVYTDERDTLDPRGPFLENRAFVVKATRLLRF